jgi:tRNA/tmRNA/rRNA uracil-C5-methylase (TrmA/RlmC/RlmD family)
VTFADDAKRLRDSGFVLREVGIYDMFPNTAHVETIGHFVRGE